MILRSEIPADFMLESSYLSPKFPNWKTPASKTPMGKAHGIMENER